MELNSVDNEPYTEQELKRIRNTIYAQYGYVFKNQELQHYFSCFDWYVPDPNLMLEQILLTKKEQMLIDEVIKREKRMKE